MAADWIKMRVWLSKDPKVIRMADVLSKNQDFIYALRTYCGPDTEITDSAYVVFPRNVTVALCVTGLLVTWGSAREQGDRYEDDLILRQCDLATLDVITDVQGFGESMAAIGWVQRSGTGDLIFPKFFRSNETPEEKHKRQNAERQAKHRSKKPEDSNVTCNVTNNVTVTPEKRREEERREEKNNTNTSVPTAPPQQPETQTPKQPPDEPPEPKPPSLVEQFVIDWNEAADRAGWPPIRKMTDARKNQFRLRSKDEFWLTHYRQAIEKADRIPGLCGRNDREWRMDVDFFLRPDTVAKIIEGKYDRWGEKPQPTAHPAPPMPIKSKRQMEMDAITERARAEYAEQEERKKRLEELNATR